MPSEDFRPRKSHADVPLSLVLGVSFAVALFVVMALAQMIGRVKPPETAIEENLAVYVAPEIEELEEEEPPPIEEEEPPPEELEPEPPQLSLDQLDIALNPGTGGSLMGDFSMPSISTSAKDLGSEDFVDFSELDQIPRPIGGSRIKIPQRLKREPVNGRIVLLIRLDENGDVLDVRVDSSDLPNFDKLVLEQVRDWRFTPPTQQGRPVKAKARLPLPIIIT